MIDWLRYSYYLACIILTLHIIEKGGGGGFGSTGKDLIFLSLDLDQRPTLELTINGTKIRGLLDTGADRSIIARKDWPRGWPVQQSSQTLQGLGYANAPDVSTTQLCWQDDKGHSAALCP